MCKVNLSAKYSLCAACLPNTCQKQRYNASVTFILTQADNEWHHDGDSGLRYADVVPEPSCQERTVIVTIRHQTAFLEQPPPWPAVLCSAACSMLQPSGRPWSNPSPAPAPGQLPGLLPNSVTKCKGRAQGPASTSHPPRAGVAESDGFLLTQKEGESQKYKSQISLKR